jgi:hypothetical protein
LVPENPAALLAGFSRWDVLSEKYFPKPDGTPRTRQGRNKLARQHGIKLARIGHVAYAKHEDVVRALDVQTTPAFVPPRRGRPRKVQPPASANRSTETAAPALSALASDDAK